MKKTLVVIGIIVMFVIGGIMSILTFGGMDIAEPDDSDLAVEHVELPPEENAFTYFAAITNMLYWPTNNVVSDYLEGKPVDQKIIEETIDRNREAIALIEKGVSCGKCSPPKASLYDCHVFIYISLERLAEILTVKSRQDRLAGDYATATDASVLMLRLGNMLSVNSASLTSYLIGNRILAFALVEVRGIATNNATKRSDLERLSECFSELASPSRGFVRAMKQQCGIMTLWIDEWPNEPLKRDDCTYLLGGNEILACTLLILRPYSLQPNRTKQLFADLYRNLITNAVLPYAQTHLRDPKHAFALQGNCLTSTAKPNFLGRKLSFDFLGNYDSTFKQRYRAESNISATCIVVAMARFKRDKGKYPDQLTELTPAYLPSVPIDPYDGMPFRYLQDKGIIYSVGLDLIDSGGSTSSVPGKGHSGTWDTEDIVFRVDAADE